MKKMFYGIGNDIFSKTFLFFQKIKFFLLTFSKTLASFVVFGLGFAFTFFTFFDFFSLAMPQISSRFLFLDFSIFQMHKTQKFQRNAQNFNKTHKIATKKICEWRLDGECSMLCVWMHTCSCHTLFPLILFLLSSSLIRKNEEKWE